MKVATCIDSDDADGKVLSLPSGLLRFVPQELPRKRTSKQPLTTRVRLQRTRTLGLELWHSCSAYLHRVLLRHKDQAPQGELTAASEIGNRVNVLKSHLRLCPHIRIFTICMRRKTQGVGRYILLHYTFAQTVFHRSETRSKGNCGSIATVQSLSRSTTWATPTAVAICSLKRRISCRAAEDGCKCVWRIYSR